MACCCWAMGSACDMAIKLKARDTQIVLAALIEFREALIRAGLDGNMEDIDRLIKSYRRSFETLTRLGIK